MKYIRVYISNARSYLCVKVGDHYEIEAEGSSSSIQKLVDLLNNEPDKPNFNLD